MENGNLDIIHAVLAGGLLNTGVLGFLAMQFVKLGNRITSLEIHISYLRRAVAHLDISGDTERAIEHGHSRHTNGD